MRHRYFDFLADSTPPPPSDDAIHIWQISLGDVDLRSEKLIGQEQRRAARYRSSRRRDQFVASRIAMRSILACYLDCPPIDVPLVSSPAGKPALAVGTGSLQFNLSHSHHQALLGISANRSVGIDLEFHDQSTLTRRTMGQMAAIYFTDQEQQQWQSTPGMQQRGLFLQLWTRKEALLKAIGDGFATSPHVADQMMDIAIIEPVQTRGDYTAAVALVGS